MSDKPESSSKLLLLYAKMKKAPVTPAGAKYMFPKRFPKPYRARESFQRLEKAGYMSFAGNDSWQVTNKGIEYIYKTARPAYGVHPDR